MQRKQINQIQVDTLLDKDGDPLTVIDKNGEIVESTIISESTKSIVYNKTVSTENFIQVYLEDMSGMLKIDNATQAKLLALLWKESEINLKDSSKGNQIYTIKANKEKWAETLNVKLQTINNTISALLEKDLLVKKDRSICVLNPNLFFKGFMKDRDKVIQTVITYKLKNI
ncbi:MAG: replication/maintenance protein RepL [Paraclostridium sp.]